MSEIFRFAVVGDLHLNSTSPASRIDDYPTTALHKLEEICNICLIKGVKHVILLGDVFHKNSQTLTYINRVMNVFTKYKEAGIEVYSVTGNHDISFEKLESLEKSPLQILYYSGLVKPLSVLDCGEVMFYGFDYPVAITPAPDNHKYNICVNHRFYNYSLSDYTLTEEHIIHNGYNLYLCGHDHMKYEPEMVQGHVIQRPGSLMRGSAHTYNLSRVPSFDIDYILNDGVQTYVKIETVPLTHLPSTECFSNSVFSKEAPEESFLELSEQIDELINRMDRHSSSGSVYDILDSLDLRPEIKSLISRYLEIAGVFRELKTKET